LRGAGGVAIGLPFLETFAPRQARAQAAGPPKRLAIFFCCNGVNMEKFFPTTPYGALTAASFPATVGSSPIASYAPKLLFTRGIHQVPRGFGRDPGGGDDHARGVGCKLTAAPLATTTEKYATGISIDQVVAKSINPGGKAPLNLMVGYRAKDVLGSISYTGPGQQASPYQDPWKAFKDWTGTGGTTSTPVVDLAAQRRQSVLDLVKADFDALKNNTAVSAADRQKLDMHFSSIRQLETTMGAAGLTACKLPDARTTEIMGVDPTKVTTDAQYQKIGAMQMDVMALAMACDYNRVVTLQWGSGAGGPIFSWLAAATTDVNSKYSHHKLSHGATTDAATMPNIPDDQWKTAIFNIDIWYMTQFKGLLDRLSMYTEPGGSVLDNSAVVYMNDLGDGLAHNWMDLPIIIAGSAGGYFKQGQYVKLTTGTRTENDTDAPSNMLLTTLANAVGAKNADGTPITNFGKAPTGKPGELTALKV
jgi:hypothetical protein